MFVHSGDSDKWSLDSEAYRTWLGERVLLGPGLNLQKPTLRSALFLALLEQDVHCSYKELLHTLKEHRVFFSNGGSQAIPIPTLRVALADLAKKLKTTDHYLRLYTEKLGRESRFRLTTKDKDNSESGIIGFTSKKMGTLQITDPREIARGLVVDGGGLPFESLYSTYRAAAQWLVFSYEQSRGKNKYEGNVFEVLGLHKLLLDQCENRRRIGLVSLAPGEGLGEVEILGRLLRKEKLKVDYLALDASDILLASHSRLVSELFSEEIKNGSLVFLPFVGNLYRLKEHLALAKIRRGNHFLAQGPVVCTFFGNCLGNDENKEWEFFKKVFGSFERWQPLAILAGVSVVRREGEKESGAITPEKYIFDPFLLETPRHLLYDLKFLKSLTPAGDEIPDEKNDEFISIPKKRGKPQHYIPPADYLTPHGIRGKVYRFHYTLKHKLATWDGQHAIESGGKILLYSIIKYEVDSLINFLKARGFALKIPPKAHEYLTITEGDEQFKYTVFAVIRDMTVQQK